MKLVWDATDDWAPYESAHGSHWGKVHRARGGAGQQGPG